MKTVKEIRKIIRAREMTANMWEPIRPCKNFRIAVAPTQKPYDFKKAKRRRKIAKQSRRINRH